MSDPHFPVSIRAAAGRVLGLPSRLVYRRSLARKTWSLPRGEPVLNYGGVLRSAGLLHGGKVKLLHLAARFPEAEKFNVLYLVSSAQPPHALDLVQWAKARGARFVWNQNGVAFPAWAGSRVREVNRPMATLLKAADFVIYQSAFCRESADHFLEPAPCPSSVLFNPVDLDAFTPATPSLRETPWRLLAAGTHHQAYRVVGPIHALKLLRDRGHDARLTVAGELRWAHAEREFDAALAKTGMTPFVARKPPFTQQEAVQIYRDAHVLLHPKYHDPCPTVPIEAMACGVPVVASRSGGMAELVGEDGGELIDVPLSWDSAAAPAADAMADAVERIMERWSERSRSARARAERLFGSAAWVATHARIFSELAPQ